MSFLRITESKMFTLEMVRAALQDPAIPAVYNLNGLWMHMDMEMGDTWLKSYVLTVLIHEAPSQVQAVGTIESKAGFWVQGTCTITLLDLPSSESWTFDCAVVDNKIAATRR